MACTVSSGKARYCKVQPGGIDKVYVISLFDASHAETLALDPTTKVLTASTGLVSADTNAGEYFEFECDPYLSALTQTIVVNEGGAVGYQQDLELVFKGAFGKTDAVMQDLANGTYQMAVVDNTGTVYFCGLKKGLICTGGSFIHNGDKALTDNLAYTLTFSCIETLPAGNCGTESNFTGQGDVTISATKVVGT